MPHEQTTPMCPHAAPRRIAPTVEWCPLCGACRTAEAWQLPELASHGIPDCEASAAAASALQDAMADALADAKRFGRCAEGREHFARAARLTSVHAWLESLPLP